MNDRNDDLAATFNLKAVVHETGLKPDTLRAWERRYGLPEPERTSGGHRLYSQRDIDTLKWLIDRQEEGLSISRAVALWQSMVERDEDPLKSMPLESAETQPVSIISGTTLDQMRDQWIEACFTFDEQRAEQILSQSMALYPPETVCFDILQAGLSAIGASWYEGIATAQQEHFASGLALRRVNSMMAMTPPPTRDGRILIGCPPGEEHTFPPLLLTLLMRRRGWDAIYLGANVPLARLEATLQMSGANLVILTAQTLPTAATMLEMAELLVEHKVPLAYGGLTFVVTPELRNHIPGHYVGDQLRNVPLEVERILNTPNIGINMADVVTTTPEYETALGHYVEKLARIEADVWDFAASTMQDHAYLMQANRDLSSYIIAALTLGDINFVAQTFEWLRGLLVNMDYKVAERILDAYILGYYHAVKRNLDARGQLLIDWLDSITDNGNEMQSKESYTQSAIVS